MGNNKVLEVRIRNGGRIFSRHFEGISPEKARDRVHGRRLGKVISVRKVPLWEVMGKLETKSLADISFGGADAAAEAREELKKMEDMTLSGIVFGKKRVQRREKGDRRQLW